MKLKYLLRGISYEILQGTDELNIENICWDSRRVKDASLFICVKGKNVDRHGFAEKAVAKGACAVIVEHEIDALPREITIIKVENSRTAMSLIAATFYGHPSTRFNLIGITGTNGKTSTSFFISKILESADRTPGVIGTIQNFIGDKILSTIKLNPTTPDPIELQESFLEMHMEGASDVVMEVSSSALDRDRVLNCEFNVGVFTNLTQDHLDEHGTMENYKKAKMKLFRMCKHGIINADDPYSGDFINYASCGVWTYGIDNEADFRAVDIEYSNAGVSFTLDFRGIKSRINIKVPGKFTVYNSLAAAAACYASGLTLEEILKGLSCIQTVKGRFETISNDKGFMVIVDYAHSPDGLKNILTSAREIAKRRVILVFGCGGNRDKTKRPIMGEIAGKLADYCIITSDNPRYESAWDIIDDIEEGIIKTKCPYEKLEDRKDAIYTALIKAQRSDIVVIAGKGHETYQIVGDNILHFDDVEVVNEYFKKYSPSL